MVNSVLHHNFNLTIGLSFHTKSKKKKWFSSLCECILQKLSKNSLTYFGSEYGAPKNFIIITVLF